MAHPAAEDVAALAHRVGGGEVGVRAAAAAAAAAEAVAVVTVAVTPFWTTRKQASNISNNSRPQQNVLVQGQKYRGNSYIGKDKDTGRGTLGAVN